MKTSRGHVAHIPLPGDGAHAAIGGDVRRFWRLWAAAGLLNLTAALLILANALWYAQMTEQPLMYATNHHGDVVPLQPLQPNASTHMTSAASGQGTH